MTKVIINIVDCSGCPFHTTTTCCTPDAWEKADDWWCNHIHCVDVNGNFKKVADYVEWNDDIEVPDWCPIMVRDEPKPFYAIDDGVYE